MMIYPFDLVLHAISIDTSLKYSLMSTGIQNLEFRNTTYFEYHWNGNRLA